jgi:ATP-dependent Clp protease ATP-binding subunit ClpC
MAAARTALPPELWNRIDEPLVFKPLTPEDVGKIAKLMLNGLIKQIKHEKEIEIIVDDSVTGYLVLQGGYDAQLGARPMRRTISRLIEGPLSRMILESGTERTDAIHIKIDNNELDFFYESLTPAGE